MPPTESLSFGDCSGDDYPDEDWDSSSEPVGSCDECGTNLYADDEWDGLCNQCAWLAEQNRGSDDVGGGGVMPVS